MRSRSGPVLLWLASTTAAIAVASAAIAQVGRQVALDSPIDGRLAQATADPAPVAVKDEQPDGSSDPASTEPDVRTYEAVGGSAAITVEDGTLEVRWATPQDGFRASVEQDPDDDELRVEFRSDAHRSRIEVEIDDGAIIDRIEEEDRR